MDSTGKSNRPDQIEAGEKLDGIDNTKIVQDQSELDQGNKYDVEKDPDEGIYIMSSQSFQNILDRNFMHWLEIKCSLYQAR